MKQNSFSQEQILGILHRAEIGQSSMRNIYYEVSTTETPFYRWRKLYGGMSVSEAQHSKELQKENAHLKRRLAERDLEIDALKEYPAKSRRSLRETSVSDLPG